MKNHPTFLMTLATCLILAGIANNANALGDIATRADIAKPEFAGISCTNKINYVDNFCYMNYSDAQKFCRHQGGLPSVRDFVFEFSQFAEKTEFLNTEYPFSSRKLADVSIEVDIQISRGYTPVYKKIGTNIVIDFYYSYFNYQPLHQNLKDDWFWVSSNYASVPKRKTAFASLDGKPGYDWESEPHAVRCRYSDQ